jgi:hypothetical protein
MQETTNKIYFYFVHFVYSGFHIIHVISYVFLYTQMYLLIEYLKFR